MKRREFVHAVAGVAVATAVAGCVDFNSGNGSDVTPENDRDEDDEPGEVVWDDDDEEELAPAPDDVPTFETRDFVDIADERELRAGHMSTVEWDRNIYDYRGHDRVRVTIGEEVNGESQLHPAVILIDDGTTIEWEWDVTDEYEITHPHPDDEDSTITAPDLDDDEATDFRSDSTSSSGVNHEHTFEDVEEEHFLYTATGPETFPGAIYLNAELFDE